MKSKISKTYSQANFTEKSGLVRSQAKIAGFQKLKLDLSGSGSDMFDIPKLPN
jgi:hypothetical protein